MTGCPYVLAAILIAALSNPLRADDAADVKYLYGASWGLAVTDVPTDDPDVEGLKGFKWPTRRGAYVYYVDKYAFAAKLGLTPVSIIDALNGEKVASVQDFLEQVAKIEPGDKVALHAHLPVEVRGRVRWKSKSLTGTAVSRIDGLKGHVIVTHDDVTGLTTFRHKDSSEFVNDQSAVDLLIAGKEGAYLPTLRIKYVAPDWIFAEGITFVINGKSKPVDMAGRAFERDNTSRIWECFNISPKSLEDDDPTMKLLRELGMSTDIKMALHGQQYRKDRRLENDEIARIGSMWRYYLALKTGHISPKDAKN